MMTRQEAFNRVAFGLLAQNKKCQGPNPNDDSSTICLYRDGNGCRCAIGFLIPDEWYTPSIEGHAVRDHRVDKIMVLAGLFHSVSDEDELEFFTDLQQVHDKIDPSGWRVHLRDLGRKWGLLWPNEL